MSDASTERRPVADLVTLSYEADLLGNIQQALAGLQGFGVMALELIQNADDAGASLLQFNITDDALMISNDAVFSSCGLGQLRCPWETSGDPSGDRRPCNFHALSRMGSRSKIKLGSQIGRFGIGFVSVYQITDSPIVRSVGVEMQLLPLTGTAATSNITDAGGTQFELRWAALSTETRLALNASPTPPDVADLVTAALVDTLSSSLFFLRNLNAIEIRRNGVLARSVEIERVEGEVALHFGPEPTSERWRILSKNAGDLAKEREIYSDFPTLAELGRSEEIQLAVPLHASLAVGLLYAFLPTEQPSGLPLHINADFFPHPTRRMITLTGEQHERYWNELLLETAAQAVAENFDALRDLLGAERLWALAGAAFAMKEAGSFAVFWKELQVVARTSVAVPTVGGRWCVPANCHLADLAVENQHALEFVGVNLLRESLRPHWTVLAALGATNLRLPVAVAALEVFSSDHGFEAETPHLRHLWVAIDVLAGQWKARLDYEALLTKLVAIPFVLDVDGETRSISSVWKMEMGIEPDAVRRYLPECPIVHSDLKALVNLSESIDTYCLENFAKDLQSAVIDPATAELIIGAAQVRLFYDLLTSFEPRPISASVGTLLADVPILASANGFVEPSRGRLPGGFVDPIGHFALIDRTQMSDEMFRLAKEVLKVDVLTFDKYVDDHLEDILRTGPTREQYVALITEIVDHRAELDAEGALRFLANVAFVKTRAGDYAKPAECYFWSATSEALLGVGERLWVDESWLPTGQTGARLEDLLLARLGMRSQPSIEHIVDHIEVVSETRDVDGIAAATQPIVRHLLERFPRMTSDERVFLEKLRTLSWLPASLDGERIQGYRHRPDQVHRSFRSAGFLSKAKVVDLPILRASQTGRTLTDFLEFLKMPEEPATDVVVAHLEHCMSENLPASEVTYAILAERFEKSDIAGLDRLSGKAFIYDHELKSYLRADQVFWTQTYFRGFWHTAGARMHQREQFYRHLGVEDGPTARSYAILLRRLAELPVRSELEVSFHEACLEFLAREMDVNPIKAATAIDEIRDLQILLNLAGQTVWRDDAAWLDSAILALPFAGALDASLVEPPKIGRPAAARLFQAFGVVRLSEIASLRLTNDPATTPALEATARLRERADLLLWLAPDQAFRDALMHILCEVEVVVTDTLLVQTEISDFDPPIRSAPTPAAAFHDVKEKLLYVRCGLGDPIDWTAAFRSVFGSLEQLTHGIDMPPIVVTAAFVVSLNTAQEAERTLLAANYTPPETGRGPLAATDVLSETDDTEAPDEDREAPDPMDLASEPKLDEIGDVPTDPSTESRYDDGPDPGSGPMQERRAGDTVSPTFDPQSDRTADDGFHSRPESGSFGPATSQHTGSHVGSPDAAGSWWGSRTGPGQAARQERRSRMLAYVNATPRSPSDDTSAATVDDIAALVDLAAVETALRYERSAGRVPTEQPHNNPGYDISSLGSDGRRRRLIEVKGLEGAWTERGVKLSQVQFAMAQQHPDDFWIYVVEHARDPANRRVNAVANPFSKVVEYWFDNGWMDTAEEMAAPTELLLNTGSRISHPAHGIGVVEQVNRRGIAVSLLVDFGDNGRKVVPYTSSTEIMD